MLASWKKAITNLDIILKSIDITLLIKVPVVKAMAFPVVTYRYENWTIKRLNTEELMLSNHGTGQAFESPLDCKEIKPINPKGNQRWIFIGRTDDEVEAPILWPPDGKSWLLEKTLMLGKVEGRKRRGDRGRDGWIASLTQWPWVWANSGI